MVRCWRYFARGVVGALLVTSVAQSDHIQPSDTIPVYLAKYGIEVQEHTVITDDGYILTAFRLPRPGAPVALLQHGILCSAWSWLDNDPDIAAGFQVYDMGYDVWLTNSRGNIYSHRHLTLQPLLDKKFWDFSFADMGRHDVPSNIRYILSQTGKKTLTYLGHSQGTSQFFAAMTDAKTKAFVEQAVNLFVALSPVSYMTHQSGKMLEIVSTMHVAAILETVFPYGILDARSYKLLTDVLCTATFGLVCEIGIDFVCGRSELDTADAIINISAHFPAGTSAKCINHYEQLVDSSEFRDYDYGTKGNMQRYNSSTPPRFDLSTARVPTALFIGGVDKLGDPADEHRAAAELPKETLVFMDTFAGFSHVTFHAGNAASFEMWFPKLQELILHFNPLPKREDGYDRAAATSASHLLV